MGGDWDGWREAGEKAVSRLEQKVERKSAAEGVFDAARYLSTRRSVGNKVLKS